MGILFTSERMAEQSNNNYVIVLENGFEYYSEHYSPTAITEAVHASGLTSTYNVTRPPIKVVIYRLSILQGKLFRTLHSSTTAPVPIAPLTSHEYHLELDKIINSIPDAFKDFVSNQAYERGHSSGYEEVLMIAQSLVNELTEPINNFKKCVLENAL